MITDKEHKKLIRYWKEYYTLSQLNYLRDLNDEEKEKWMFKQEQIEKILFK